MEEAKNYNYQRRIVAFEGALRVYTCSIWEWKKKK